MTIPNNFIVQSQVTGGNTGVSPRCWSLTTTDLQATVFATGYLNDYAGNFKANDVAFLTYGYGDATQASAQCYITDVGGDLSFVVGILGASGPLSFKGTWDASTNTPTLPATPALDMLGDFYIVSVAGTFETIAYGIGDWIVAGPSAWTRVANGATGLALTDGHIFVGNVTNAATDVAVSGDLTLVNTGAFKIANGAIVDAMVNASAAIALSKLAALAINEVLVSNGTGAISASGVTGAELAYLSGVTAAIQTQLNAKAPSASPTFTGTVAIGAKLDAATGANTSVGTFTLDGVTPVAVANTSITASSLVFISKVSTGGTPGTVPTYTLSAGVGFSVVGAALDTSVYNYLIIN